MDNNAVNLNRDTLGSVQIANDVVAIIAGLAATEVDGITAMAGNISNELMSKVGYRSLTKGVKVDIDNGQVKVELSLRMDYGHNIPSTCAKVQDRVKTTIENMTGLEVVNVNVRIAGVDMLKGKKNE
ncbi:Asp23/Gls24 family envelope stress response protein [Lacrimispora saccharolytica]|uniref:Asp23/Gls24 family envelope stress response protein n=1 Tax=Lacrimispora saccharolytica TaxID=84030 RepID=UPI001B6E2DB6|nr:Asp23/Gls24 family envelope stress response protein [Lacrimispora saccharolytica]MBP9001599.1 Asp23/Gls24 family envelope stress response protein [Lachnospiraceae bacterium]MBS7329545.1 Asp23/Gls24 family envelope stress response protein [Lachnospiraceae bacterium]MCF2655980.1 Asp23/Gls24 family envelope stress response protein [Lacrimispora saccharolytica]MCI7557431.1 Asp23/Gls24 family envelope stress response protein [Lachnospiraceae bacterium]MDD7547950.1 Asp23/Gls24 family envelope str